MKLTIFHFYFLKQSAEFFFTQDLKNGSRTPLKRSAFHRLVSVQVEEVPFFERKIPRSAASRVLGFMAVIKQMQPSRRDPEAVGVTFVDCRGSSLTFLARARDLPRWLVKGRDAFILSDVRCRLPIMSFRLPFHLARGSTPFDRDTNT